LSRLLCAEEAQAQEIEAGVTGLLASPEKLALVESKAAELFSETRFQACEAFLQELTDDADASALLYTRVASNFSERALNGAQIPAKVVQGGIAPLRGFVQAKWTQASRSRCQEISMNLVRKFAEKEFGESSEGQAIDMAFQAKKEDLCFAFRSILAQSDHKPIRATFIENTEDKPDSLFGMSFTVASHNVQERCTNGVVTYISSLPFIPGTKGHAAKLVDCFLQESVRLEHIRQVIGFVRRELLGAGATSDAVVLQELSPDVIEALQLEFCGNSLPNEESLGVHASASTSVPETKEFCFAITCIVARHPFEVMPDVEVTTEQATKSITRRYATVFFPKHRIVLVSLHVRHSAEKGKHGAHSPATEYLNLENIETALQTVAGALSGPGAVGSRAVLAVGDFNGAIGSLNANRLTRLNAEHCVCLATCAPVGPTVPPPVCLPIDGGVVIFSRRSSGLCAADAAAAAAAAAAEDTCQSLWTAVCEVIERLA
jgi:formaldehyde-activating enzyme involved in methanogenesis